MKLIKGNLWSRVKEQFLCGWGPCFVCLLYEVNKGTVSLFCFRHADSYDSISVQRQRDLFHSSFNHSFIHLCPASPTCPQVTSPFLLSSHLTLHPPAHVLFFPQLLLWNLFPHTLCQIRYCTNSAVASFFQCWEWHKLH